MSWKKRLLQNFKLYAITDLKTDDPIILRRIDQALLGGIDVIQLRSKHLTDKELFKLGKKIRVITTKRKKLFIVNDRIDLALLLKADGIHLGQDDLPMKDALKLLKKKSIFIGRSTHSVAQARKAEREGADYIGFGPIFGTPTKPTYKPIGLESISHLNKILRIPFVCIGGINKDNIDLVVQSGAERIAVVRAVFNASSPRFAAKELKERISRV